MPLDRYAYSGIMDRPKVSWPNGARVALWIVPNVEHYEYIAAPHTHAVFQRVPHPDVLSYSHRDFGNRVGIWRLFEVADEFDLKCSVSLNLGVYDHFPEIMEAIEARKWDIICHGYYNHILNYSSKQEEIDFVEACVAKSKSLVGRSFDGWFSPGLTFTHDTVDIIAARGVQYLCEWTFDEQPVFVETTSGRPFFSMPYQFDINDGFFTNRRYRHSDSEAFARLIMEHFDRLYADGEAQGRVMCIALHPYISGQPHNIGPLKRALSYILGHQGVWNATGIDILNWWKAHYFENPATGAPANRN